MPPLCVDCIRYGVVAHRVYFDGVTHTINAVHGPSWVMVFNSTEAAEGQVIGGRANLCRAVLRATCIASCTAHAVSFVLHKVQNDSPRKGIVHTRFVSAASFSRTWNEKKRVTVCLICCFSTPLEQRRHRTSNPTPPSYYQLQQYIFNILLLDYLVVAERRTLLRYIYLCFSLYDTNYRLDTLAQAKANASYSVYLPNNEPEVNIPIVGGVTGRVIRVQLAGTGYLSISELQAYELSFLPLSK